jgi:hypothetical protein
LQEAQHPQQKQRLAGREPRLELAPRQQRERALLPGSQVRNGQKVCRHRRHMRRLVKHIAHLDMVAGEVDADAHALVFCRAEQRPTA